MDVSSPAKAHERAFRRSTFADLCYGVLTLSPMLDVREMHLGLIPLAPISPPSIPTSLNTSSSLTNASPLRSPSLITPVSFAHDALTRQAVEWTISSSLLVSGQQLSSMVAATDTVDVGPSIERKQSSVSDSQHEGIPALSFLTLGKGSECSDVFTCSVCE